MAPSIGIDLGTSYVSMGVFRNDRFEVIPNDEGDLTTPSFVAFTDKGPLIGNPAKNQLARNPHNTVFNVHRFIGRRFADAEVQADIRHLPFLVVDRLGKPAIQVEYRGEIKVLMPVEIIAIILARVKKMAENYLNVTVDNALIAIPSCWTSPQRQSITEAGLIAGLNVLSVIAAPSSATFAYCFDKRGDSGERNILVLDLGGGTFGATLATIEEGIIEVRSVAGDTHLGGEDFDTRLVNHFGNEFKSRYSKDPTTNARSLCRLRSACERAKRTLSSSTIATIDIEYLFEGVNIMAFITRIQFEELCQDLFRSVFIPVGRVLSDAKFDKSKIHEVILIGGSSRIPQIRKLVASYFNGKEPSKSLDHDQATCCGAAIYAAILSGDTSSTFTNEIILLDVTPFSLGIETRGGIMTPLTCRNSTVPTNKSEVFELGDFDTCYNNSDSKSTSDLLLKIYEGVHRNTKDNIFLGTLALMNVSPKSRLEITFDLGREFLRQVSAVDRSTGRTIRSYLPCYWLSKEDLESMTAAVSKYNDDAETEVIRGSEKNALEQFIYSLKMIYSDEPTIPGSLEESGSGDFSAQLNEALAWLSECRDFSAQLDEALAWLDDNQHGTAQEFMTKREELQKIADQLLVLRS